MTEVIIDVRESDEFELQHVKDSINVPLSRFSLVAPGVLNQLKDRKIIFMCHSGARATQASEQAKTLGYNAEHEFGVYKGGITSWLKEGKEVQKGGKAPLPLIRQVQIIMGTMFMIFSALAVFLDPMYAAGALFLSGGLLMAGITGNCALANTIANMPWNKADPTLKKQFCQATGKCD